MNMIRKAATALAGTAIALGAAAAPAAAGPADGDYTYGEPVASFYGTCTAATVAYWRVEPAPGKDKYDDYQGVNFKIYVRGLMSRQEVLFPGDYRELHRYFEYDGIPKTIRVTADGVEIASHTYGCGAFSSSRSRHR